LELSISIVHVLFERDQVGVVLDRIPRSVDLPWYSGAVFVSLRLIIVVHAQFISGIGQFYDLESKANGRSIVADSVVRVLDVVV